MSRTREIRELPYAAKARLADNLYIQRSRAGYSQEALSERAMVSASRIGKLENRSALGSLDTYVRLAGGLSISLNDLLAGVTWTPATVESEYKAGYKVEFEVDPSERP